MPEAVLLEALGDVVLEVSAAGRVAWASARAQELLGRPPAELAGRALADLLPEARLDREQRCQVPTPDGETVPVLVSPAAAGPGHVLLLKDLRPWAGKPPGAPGRGDVERALGTLFRGAMRVAVGDLAQDEDVDAIAVTLAEQGRRLMPGTDCLIALVEPARPGLFRVAAASGAWGAGIAGHEFELGGTLVGQALEARRTLETLEAHERTVLGRVLTGGSIRTTRLIPILAEQPLPDGRTAIGTIGFYSRRGAPFTERQRRLMDDFATLASLALMRGALRRAARLGAERLQTALELAVDLSRSLNVRDVVGRLLERTLAAVGAERVVILRVEGSETVTEDYRDVDGHPEVVGYRHPIQLQPLMARALASGQPVVGGRYLSGVFPELLRGALEGVTHTLTVPLMLGSEPVAVLVLSRRRDRAFRADEVATIRLLGGLAALALRNAGLYAQAREANRAKSDFLNMAAHELRTPFTVVAGYVSMLKDGSFGPAPPAFLQPVETLSTKSGELGRLVEDLLLAARLETGGLPVQRVRLNAGAAAEAALERAAPRSRLLDADVGADLPEETVDAFGDPGHVARILDNLLNNALSYTRGAAYVRLRVRRTGAWVRFEVEDHGRGIPAANAERVFERFFRGQLQEEAGQRATPPGSGLGLYICRQLASRQAGRLELEWSRVGEGSRFVLSLPAAGGVS